MAIKLKDLKKVAEELNEVLGLKPEIDVDLDEEELMAAVKEAITMINPKEDEFSEKVQGFIDELAEEPEPKKEKKEEVEEKSEIEEEFDELIESIDSAKKRTALIAICKEHDEFKTVLKNKDDFEELDELKEAMKDALTVKPVSKKKAEKIKEEKTKEAKAAKKEPKEKKEKGPGVISTIVSLIENAGKKGITKEEILEELMEAFPDKAKESMKNTINVQVPYRVNKEHWPVVKLDGDRYAKK